MKCAKELGLIKDYIHYGLELIEQRIFYLIQKYLLPF